MIKKITHELPINELYTDLLKPFLVNLVKQENIMITVVLKVM